MRHLNRARGLGVLCALILGCGASDGGGGATDATPPVADSTPPSSDSAVAVPDAAAIAPDTAVVAPDAAVLAPDAAPDAAVPSPDAAAAVPPGGDRPSRIFVPSAAPPAEGWPLILLLHGYRASGTLIDRQFGLSRRVEPDGFVLLLPEGTLDGDGFQHWNADLGGMPDDIGYLRSLLEETIARYPIDGHRVYVMGHSNGGYMTYRMACAAPDLITAIIPASSRTVPPPEECQPGPPLGLLHIQGDLDGDHPFEGTPEEPGVDTIVADWAARNHCQTGPTDEPPIDAELTGPGAETIIRHYDQCDLGTTVGRWRMQGVVHAFIFSPEGSARVVHDILAMHRDLPGP